MQNRFSFIGLALLVIGLGAVWWWSVSRPPDICSTKAPPAAFGTPSTGGPTPGTTPVCTYAVVRAYPHDREAFTQGLIYLGDGKLLEGTGLNGRSSLRRVRLETGEVLQRHDLSSEYFGEGVTALEGRVYQLTWRSGVGFVYDLPTFELQRTFTYITEGWGLTHDGQRLIMSDGTDALHFLDPATLTVTGSLRVRDGETPVPLLNELEYINGWVYANVWKTDRIAKIDPTTGRVAAWLDLAGLRPAETPNSPEAVLNGIAYDAA
ncbi:MAG: glutaminyl-peptide cyclotransferase, partial [Anaerolineales bacterium]|nr:glutaminyl-peptide cyclotransferase [Anaerolineales bacterium]